MKHSTEKEIITSLRRGITLLTKDNDSIWVSYIYIEEKLKEGYTIFNDDKRALYENLKGK